MLSKLGRTGRSHAKPSDVYLPNAKPSDVYPSARCRYADAGLHTPHRHGHHHGKVQVCPAAQKHTYRARGLAVGVREGEQVGGLVFAYAWNASHAEFPSPKTSFYQNYQRLLYHVIDELGGFFPQDSDVKLITVCFS